MRHSRLGFSIIELLVTLAIASFVFVTATSAYQTFIEKSQAEVMSAGLLRVINLARNEAIMRGIPISLSKSNDNSIFVTCDNQVIFQIQNKTDGNLHLRLFPFGQTNLQFLPSGLLHGENGSFWYCDQNKINPTWSIIVNQLGRARLVYPDKTGKIRDEKGEPLIC